MNLEVEHSPAGFNSCRPPTLEPTVMERPRTLDPDDELTVKSNTRQDEAE